MRSFLIQMIAVAMFVVALAAGQSVSPANSGAPAGAVSGVDASARPAPKFDIANIDKSLDPCADFYQYACAKWIKNNPIPPDYADWVSFSEVYEYNLGVLHGILEK